MLSGTGLRTSTSGGGRTAYGTVPEPIPTPPSVFSQLNSIPGFTANTGGAGRVVGSELAGNVSPGTMNALKTGAAQFGVGNGLGFGSGLETNQLFGNIAGFSEGQAHRGVQDYLSEVGALGPTMTNPNLAAEISARNATLAAAPDPKLAAQQAFNDWLRGFGIVSSAGTPNAPWAAGGILGPARGFSTTHSNWGGMGGTPPDALGFPGYDMTSQQGYGTVTATASPPPGGWPGAPEPYGTGYAVGPRYDWSGFYPGLSDEEAAAIGG
jgi:hypothetical protein